LAVPLILIDTNILIYSIDPLDLVKQEQALGILEYLQTAGLGCLSVQCLSEFAAVATRRVKPPLPWANVYIEANRLAKSFRVYSLTEQIVLTAVRGARDHQLSYYDAQLWATALLNQVPVIFSEDFNSGSTLEGVRLINPFAAQFKLQDWQ
jgi:predicted nucleic acid-binding protein